MQMRKYVLAILLAVLPCSAIAQDTYLDLLEFEYGIRNMGMGGTGVSSVTRMPSSYFNPATLAWADGLALAYETQPFEVFNLDLDITDVRLTFGDDSSENGWRLGGEAGYRRFHYELQDVIFPPLGDVERTDDLYFAALAAGFRTENFAGSAGVSMKRSTIETNDGDSSVETMDVGVIAAFPVLVSGSLLQPRLGVSIAGFDNGVEINTTTYGIRNVTRAGAGLDLAMPDQEWAGRQVSLATASLDVDYIGREDDDSSWATGFEVGVLELLFLRAGYEWRHDDNYTIRRLGAGLGWEMGRWFARADYAHETPSPTFYFVESLSRDMYGIILGARI